MRPRPASTTVSSPMPTTEPEAEVVTSVANLIAEGELSHTEVIEEMVNQGIIPVEMTDLGKLPVAIDSKKVMKQLVHV